MDSVHCIFSEPFYCLLCLLVLLTFKCSKDLIVLPSQHSVQHVFGGRVLVSSYLMGHQPSIDNSMFESVATPYDMLLMMPGYEII